MVNPYNDYFSVSEDNVRIRTIEEVIEENQLVWHRDHYNRKVMVVEGEGWGLQFDNEKPFTLEKGKMYHIPKMMYHRVWRGKGDLRMKIWDEE